MRRSRVCALAGLAAVALFLVLIARFWHPVYGFTALLQLDGSNDDTKISAFRELPVYVYRNTGGYDGLYYAQIAYDPSLRNPELKPAVDNLTYRARRILPPALAWLLAGGQPQWIVYVYACLNIAAWLALAVVLWRLLTVTDFRGWLAWIGVLFSAGALGSVRLALTDLVALAILAIGMWALERARPRTAVALIASAGLARETSLLALAGLLRRPWFSRANAARIVGAAAPLGLWLAYLSRREGPAHPAWNNYFELPVAGLLHKWSASFADALHGNPDHRVLMWATVLSTFALTAQLAFVICHRRTDDPWWRLGAAYGGLMLCLGTAVWEGQPGAATRVLLPLTLAFNILAVRTRASLAWLVAGNLTVASGLLMLKDVPDDPHELAGTRVGAIKLAVETPAEGWYGVEHTSRHRWAWSSGRAELRLQAWPRQTAFCELTCTLRGFAPCNVTVRDGETVLWRGEVGTTRVPITVPVALHEGRASLAFMTETPGAPESPSPGARRLAFAVYDVQVKLAEKH
jgi:hypothetical protein